MQKQQGGVSSTSAHKHAPAAKRGGATWRRRTRKRRRRALLRRSEGRDEGRNEGTESLTTTLVNRRRHGPLSNSAISTRTFVFTRHGTLEKSKWRWWRRGEL
jgi:hypothetical protein